MEHILPIMDCIIWCILAISTGYLLVFSIAALPKRTFHYPASRKQHRIVVLFPAYQEDAVIITAVHSFLQQDYPRNLYDVVVISDHMKEETNNELALLPVLLLRATYENSSKAKALNLAMDKLQNDYQIAVILDADNRVDPLFLQYINNAYAAGSKAMQAHRKAKNRNTDVAVLDAVSEEINNSIFRKGHVNLGLSSALIGSGMAFDYDWFKENIKKIFTAGEDKELEILLLKQRYFIDYLEEVYVYDEKTQGNKGFYNQRRRWLAAQYSQWHRIIRDLPGALFSFNIDYCDKLFQWMMPPRLLLLGSIGFFACLSLFIHWEYSLKWWGLFIITGITLCLAIPDYLVDDRFKRAIRKIPLLFIMMFLNLFRMKGVNKKFIHTAHGEVK